MPIGVTMSHGRGLGRGRVQLQPHGERGQDAGPAAPSGTLTPRAGR